MVKLKVGIFVVFLLAFFGCSSGNNNGSERPSQNISTVGMKPKVQKVDQPVPDGKNGVYEGYLEIDPFKYSKGVQGTTVHTKSGRAIGIAVWYDKDHMKFINKRVVIKGGMAETNPDPRAQSARYFKTEYIKLAPGETPYKKVPVEIPHPPLVLSGADIKKLPGGWGVAVGKATYERKFPGKATDGPYMEVAKVTLTLKDGYTITKHLWHGTSSDSELYKDGNMATIVFMYRRNSGKKVTPFKYCHGKYVWCGMKKRPFKYILNFLIKGGYEVDEGKKRIGFLQLYGEKYLFTKSKKKASKSLKKRFSMIRKPKGSIKLEYIKGVNPKAELKSFRKDEVVAHITFNGKDKWQIRVGNNGSSLYFHSLVSEIQTWAIKKSFSIKKLR